MKVKGNVLRAGTSPNAKGRKRRASDRIRLTKMENEDVPRWVPLRGYNSLPSTQMVELN